MKRRNGRKVKLWSKVKGEGNQPNPPWRVGIEIPEDAQRCRAASQGDTGINRLGAWFRCCNRRRPGNRRFCGLHVALAERNGVEGE